MTVDRGGRLGEVAAYWTPPSHSTPLLAYFIPKSGRGFRELMEVVVSVAKGARARKQSYSDSRGGWWV